MHASLDELENAVDNFLIKEDFESALGVVSSFIVDFIKYPCGMGVVFSSFRLDNLCQKIGALMEDKFPPSLFKGDINNNLIVYIASQLQISGGHTAVIKDFISLQPTKEHVILITNIYHDTEHKLIYDHFKELPVTLFWASENSLTAKFKWLQNKLTSLRPSKTFLFNHHQDSVAIASLQPAIVEELYFYHHADHHLTLGVHLDHALHIDPHSFGFYNCRENLKVEKNIYLPLICLDQPYRQPDNFLKQGHLKTCSSGNCGKFESSIESSSYFSLIPQILKATKGVHVHIGKLPLSHLQHIYQGLSAHGIPKESFVYIPWVKSVWQAMIDNQIDLYINSFPIVGLKATVEVMGSGTPIIFYENYISQLLSGHFMGYPGAFIWKQPNDLLQHLRNINTSQLMEESKIARKYYVENFRPEILAQELSKCSHQMLGISPQALPKFNCDKFQISLDTMQSLEKIYASSSWRLTEPLRSLKRGFNRMKSYFSN